MRILVNGISGHMGREVAALCDEGFRGASLALGVDRAEGEWGGAHIYSSFDLVPEEDLAKIERFHTLPQIIEDEITEPVTWYLGFAIPIEFFQRYSGIDPKLSGQEWKANFTKCADKCSHPCWLTWQKLVPPGGYHVPDQFGTIIFE